MILFDFSLPDSFSASIIKRLAEEPELTKTEWLVFSHSDHNSSNSLLKGPLVSCGIVFIQSARSISSWSDIVSFTNGIL